MAAEKIAQISTALAALENHFIAHREKFEKWRNDNIKQIGTPAYNKYVEDVTAWEAGIKEQERLLIEERNSLIMTQDVDTQLENLLLHISPKDFMMAVVNMTSKDPTFFPFLLSSYKKLQASGAIRPKAVYHQFGPSSSTSYAHASANPYSAVQYGAAVAAPPPAVHPYAATRPELAVNGGMVNRPFERVVSGSNISEAWKVDEAARKSYRAPSPVKDYRNPSTVPFRDFSQT